MCKARWAICSRSGTLGFTVEAEGLTSMLFVVRILAGLGCVTVFLAYLKTWIERRRWRRFKLSVHQWVDNIYEVGDTHPEEFSDDQWRAECERMLTDANFSPLDIRHLVDIAVVVAKGIAADKIAF